jgi:uncharacterized integral membrane protein
MDINKLSETVFDFFNGNPILNLITLLLAISGIVFTIYFYSKSKKVKLPIYVVRSINLVKEKIQKIDSVQILYSGDKVSNLSISKIALWNAGKETINSQDVALNNSIKVKIKDDFEILDAEILFQKNDANDFKTKISEDNKNIEISFDFFDFEEGIVLQIFHSGNSSDDISVEGTIKSVKCIKRKDVLNSILPSILVKVLKNGTRGSKRKMVKFAMGWGTLITGLFLIMVLPFIPQNTSNVIENKFISERLIPSILGIPYIWLGINMIKRHIPKGFDIFNEEF